MASGSFGVSEDTGGMLGGITVPVELVDELLDNDVDGGIPSFGGTVGGITAWSASTLVVQVVPKAFSIEKYPTEAASPFSVSTP